jgi:hypothetical protein
VNGYNHRNPLRRAIGGLDRLLRRLEGIAEYSENPDCLLRFAGGRAQRDLHLADGCRVARGAQILDLHLWNEHLLGLPSGRCGLARASALRRDLGASLRELAGRIETDPSLAAVAALRAWVAFVPSRRIGKVLRIARAFGFAPIRAAGSARALGRLSAVGENLLMYALAWTFNPGSLRRREVLRERCEMWISRSALIATYGGTEALPAGLRERPDRPPAENIAIGSRSTARPSVAEASGRLRCRPSPRTRCDCLDAGAVRS